MSHFFQRSLGIALAAAILPAAALAQQAVVNTGANVRAGPGVNYPVVAQLSAGVSVDVNGCVTGYEWCDVTVSNGDLRGWIFARNISSPYQGQPVPLANYGATIGIPLITFAIGSYWGSHYRDRPFYGEPRYWGGHRPPLPPRYSHRPPDHRFEHRPNHRPNYRPDHRPGWDGGHGQRPGGHRPPPHQVHHPDGNHHGRPDGAHGRPGQQVHGNRGHHAQPGGGRPPGGHSGGHGGRRHD